VIFTLDRLQYSEKTDEYFLYEFVEVSNISRIKNANTHSELLNVLKDELNIIDRNKIDFIFSLNKEKLNKYIIVYQENNDDFIDDFIVLKCKVKGVNWQILNMNFNELSRWFNELNSMGIDKNSKSLGVVRGEDEDYYVNKIINEIYNLENYSDDCGLKLTKKLLAENQTTAIDLDLFQYIASTNEYILYEFLKRDNIFINNITSHPMRYCWTGRRSDNKTKFISLWRAKKYFGGKLYLINYSADKEEKVSVIDVLNLSEEKGFLEENKYCMTRNELIAWLKDMNNYKSSYNDYLSDFKFVNYNEDFFKNWKDNKNKYGKEFLK
jgi:hypothetical protein